MVPESSRASRGTFFSRWVTSRQFLTLWSPVLAVCLLAATWLVSPWGLDPAGLSSTNSGTSVGGQTANDHDMDSQHAAVRHLTVNTLRVDAAGPPEIRQRYTGIVVPRRTSLLAAKALGRVEEVLVDIGDQVEPGQVLVRLDQDQLRAELQVAEANLAVAKDTLSELVAGPRTQDIDSAKSRVEELKANLRLAESNLERTRQLRGTYAISQQELDEAETQVQATLKQLESAKQQLALLEEGTRKEQIAAQRNQVASLEATIDRVRVRLAEQLIVAPYGGQVQQRSIDEGEVVSPGQLLLELVESTALEVRVGIPPNHIHGELQPSDFEIVTQVGMESISLPAEFERMSPAIDASTRTQQCVFRLRESASDLVRIGDAVSVSIRDARSAASEGGFWVPSDALSSGPRGLWIVYIAAAAESGSQGRAAKRSGNGVYTVQRRPVELLQTFDRWSKVRGPLRADEQLIVDGLHRVVQGQKVEVQAPESFPIKK